MKYLKAFIAGLAFPATLLPFIYLILYSAGHQAIHTQPLQFIPLFIPLVFGLWNVGYFLVGNKCSIQQRNPRLWVTGISLGLLVGLVGIFMLHLPKLLFGFTGVLFYLPIIIVPIIYGIIWRYIVHSLNTVVGLKS